MTLISIKNPMYHKYFINMCPTYSFINRSNGKFNKTMGFMKDYSALLSTAWDIDKVYDSCLSFPDENNMSILTEMGLDDYRSDAQKDLREQTLAKLVSMDLTGPFKDRYQDPFGYKNAG